MFVEGTQENTTAAVTPETVTPETPPVEAPPAEDPKIAARFAALSRREKQAVEKERAVKELEARISQEREQYSRHLEAIQKAKENPVALLEAAGIDFDYLTRFILNDNKVAPDDKLGAIERRIAEVEAAAAAKVEALQQAEIQRQEQYIETMIDSYRQELKSEIASKADDYEMIIANGAEDDVFSMITEHFAATGEILPPEVAAKQFEDQLYQEAVKFLGLKKFSAHLKPPVAEPEIPKLQEPVQKERLVPKSLSSTQVLGATPRTQSMSSEERLKQAAAKLQFLDRKR